MGFYESRFAWILVHAWVLVRLQESIDSETLTMISVWLLVVASMLHLRGVITQRTVSLTVLICMNLQHALCGLGWCHWQSNIDVDIRLFYGRLYTFLVVRVPLLFTCASSDQNFTGLEVMLLKFWSPLFGACCWWLFILHVPQLNLQHTWAISEPGIRHGNEDSRRNEIENHRKNVFSGKREAYFFFSMKIKMMDLWRQTDIRHEF